VVLVWLNGRIVSAHSARIPALDRGFLHGDGVYDTWRTYAGVPFAVAAHLKRMVAATRTLALPRPGPATVWERRTRQLVARNGLTDAAVRLTITRGAAGDELVPAARSRPTVLLTVRPLPRDLARRQAHGIRVVLLPFPRDLASPWAGMKLVGHVSAVIGRRYAARKGADDGLYVTADGEVTEATTSNLFIVERGGLVTPPLDGSVLPGVTREIVARLARRAGLAVHQEPLSVGRVRRAAEVFLTASTVEVVPVVRIDRRAVGTGRPGPTTIRMQALYRTYLERQPIARTRRMADPESRRNRA
jgi:branched-subunit amino acid aminotransferase/4-amino-4-deoxychorismate lyase